MLSSEANALDWLEHRNKLVAPKECFPSFFLSFANATLVFASHHITSHHITSHHITSHHITSHHITSHHITSHHITSHHITSHHITSQHSENCSCLQETRGWTTCMRCNGLYGDLELTLSISASAAAPLSPILLALRLRVCILASPA